MHAITRHDRNVRAFLLDGIRDGRFPPGARLPTERALSLQLGVPRSAVRDALAVLEGAGAVRRRIGSGTYVGAAEAVSAEESPSPAPNGPDSSPAEIMEARLLLEPQLAHLAAMNADQADFARFDECIRQGDAAEDFEAFEFWDAALHDAIARATHNRLVIELYAMVTRARDQTEWGELKRRTLSAERLEHYRREHHAIVEALRGRDVGRAEAALAAHLERVRSNLFGR